MPQAGALSLRFPGGFLSLPSSPSPRPSLALSLCLCVSLSVSLLLHPTFVSLSAVAEFFSEDAVDPSVYTLTPSARSPARTLQCSRQKPLAPVPKLTSLVRLGD